MEVLNKDSSLLFATFSPYYKGKRDPKNGNVEPFISFFPKRMKRFVLIDQPHTGSDIVEPVIEDYIDGKLKKKYRLINLFYKPFYLILKSIRSTENDTSILFKIRDIISVVHVGFASKEKFQYFVGLESVNVLAGLILKKMGKVDCVIYYVSDYSPIRYKSRIFNSVYLALDRFCCYHADFIWDVSKAMQKARIEAGLDKLRSAPVIHVPNGLFPEYIKHLPANEIRPFSLVFMGSLGHENGPDLAIEALSAVARKFPKAMLHIIGGGSDLERLKKFVVKKGLLKYVKFYGMIPKDEDMLATLRQFYIALAPYKNIKGSVRFYGDSLKLRAYMASGLPVVTTEVPPLGRELNEFGSAILVKDSAVGLADAIVDLLSNPSKYKKLRFKAIAYGKNNTWDETFKNAFMQMKNPK
ncbi:MAG: glycosyltransferase [Candidatus Levyibacteriota bacterium]